MAGPNPGVLPWGPAGPQFGPALAYDPYTGRSGMASLGPSSIAASTFIGVSDADLQAGWRPIAGYTTQHYGMRGQEDLMHGSAMGAQPMAGNRQVPVYGQPIYTRSHMDAFLGRAAYQDVLEMQRKLYNYGFIDKIQTPGFADASFMKGLEYLYATANQNGVTINDIFARMDNAGARLGLKIGPTGLAGGGESGDGGGTSTTTSTSISLTSRAGAWQVLISALTNELGREPTDAEISRFSKSLNAKERADPSVSTSTTTYDAEGNAKTSTTSRQSGVEPTAEAMVFARSPAMAAERRQYKGAQYFDVIADMLSGGG